nr:hypothetical protein [Actinomycetales bacterium]
MTSSPSDPFAPGGSGRSQEPAPTEWGGYGEEQWGSAAGRPASGEGRWSGPPPAAPPTYGGQAREPAGNGARAGTAGRSRGYLALVSLLGLVAVAAVAVAVIALTGGLGRAPAPSPTANSWSYGSNAGLDARWDECSAGDMLACDALYNAAPPGTDYRR